MLTEHSSDGVITIDFGTSASIATMLAKATAQYEDNPPKTRTRTAIAKALYQHRADLEEIHYTMTFLMRKRGVLLGEVEYLVGSLEECVDEEGPRSAEEEVALRASVASGSGEYDEYSA